MFNIKEVTAEMYKRYGRDGLAYYLQGSGGNCIACGCKTPPHDDNCEFVKEVKLILKGVE